MNKIFLLLKLFFFGLVMSLVGDESSVISYGIT
jgi:hypothetical protein